MEESRVRDYRFSRMADGDQWLYIRIASHTVFRDEFNVFIIKKRPRLLLLLNYNTCSLEHVRVSSDRPVIGRIFSILFSI